MLWQRLKREFRYSTEEIVLIALTALLSGFILSFRKWGVGATADVNAGVENLVVSTVLTFIALMIHFSAQKWYGVRKGFHIKYVINYAGLAISLFITIIFNGVLFFLAPGYAEIKARPEHRLGKWRFRPYFKEYGYTVNFGIFSNLIAAGIMSFFSNHLATEFLKINLLIAVFTLIPAPRYGGFHIFFASFYQYAFMIGFTLAYAALLYYLGIVWAGVFGLIVGAIGFFWVFKQL